MSNFVHAPESAFEPGLFSDHGSRADLWADIIKGSVPDDKDNPALRIAAVKELKSIIMERFPFNEQVVAVSQTDDQGFYDIEAVKSFVAQNWKGAAEARLRRGSCRPSKKT